MAVLVSNDQDLLLLLLTFYDTQGVEQVIEPCYMLYRDGGTRRTTPPTVKINIYRGRKKKPVTHSLLSFKRALFGQQQHRCSEVARLQNSVDSSSNENKFKGKKKKKKKRDLGWSYAVLTHRNKKTSPFEDDSLFLSIYLYNVSPLKFPLIFFSLLSYSYCSRWVGGNSRLLLCVYIHKSRSAGGFKVLRTVHITN